MLQRKTNALKTKHELLEMNSNFVASHDSIAKKQWLDPDAHFDTLMSCAVFDPLLHQVHSLCGIIRFNGSAPCTVECHHEYRYAMRHVYNGHTGTLCISCGTIDVSRVLVDMDYCTVALMDDQCVTPSVYIDKCRYLPPVIHTQVSLLCNSHSSESTV